MTYKDIATMVASCNLPYAYYQSPDGTEQAPPFICFFYDRLDGFYADGTNYAPVVGLVVELYTDNKDFTTERTVESVLNSSGLAFDKSEVYIDTEKMYQITYTTEVVITGE